MDPAETVEGSVRLRCDALAFAGGEDWVETIDDECRMRAFGRSEIELDAEMKIHGTRDEPDALALSHLRRFFNFGEAEDAGVKGASAAFAGNGNGDLHVIEAENWHDKR